MGDHLTPRPAVDGHRAALPWRPAPAAPIASAGGADELADLGIDLGAPAPAVEDAVMADLGLNVMRLLGSREAGAEIERRGGLADGADIVVLALDTEERGALDGARLDAAVARGEAVQRQRMVLEDALHRLEIEIRRQIHHRHVLVIEAPRRLGAFAVAAHE